MNTENGKKTYASIPVPEALSELVDQTIASHDKEEIRKTYENKNQNQNVQTLPARRRPVWKGCMAAAAAILVAGTVGLNTSPAFAEDLQKLPVIGQLAQVLTFRSYQGTVEDVELDINVPVIQSKGDGELPAKVNAQIQQIVSEYEATGKAEFAEYKEAFFATGGTEAEWADRTMSLTIDYDVKYFNDDVLSLEISTAKGWVSTDEEHYFYNIDLKTDEPLTLKGLLGEDYVAVCNKSIVKQINERLAADESLAFFGYGANAEDGIEGFESIEPTTDFYLNKDGNVVISFPEYSIAPGYMGIQEFVIEK